MKHMYYLLLSLLSLNSCKEEKRVPEKINFNTDYKLSSEILHKVDTDTVDWKYQIAASDYAMKGDHENALIHWDKEFGTKTKELSQYQIDSLKAYYTPIDARSYIVDQSKKNRVIIINEAHHNSSHRVFLRSLLLELFENGYRNLGLEALSNGENLDSELNSRKYPVLKTGHYIKEPQFGNLVREALEIGYDVFAFETTGEGEIPREIEQAQNIKEKINSKPDEKFLIYSGYDHALEGDHQYWGKAMAGRLAEYTGINPLTINQVEYSETSKPDFNHPLLKASDVKVPTVLIDKNNSPLRYKQGDAWTDIAVIHPTTNYIDRRPHWLFSNDTRKVSIDLDDIDIEFPVMVLAYKKGEDIRTAVPVDIVEVKNKNEVCTLGLKKGRYDIVVTNKKESLRFEQKVD